jgi:hypothetical protein
MSTAKERHYQQLASKLSNISRELEETQRQSAVLAQQLTAMNNLGAMQAAQYVLQVCLNLWKQQSKVLL